MRSLLHHSAPCLRLGAALVAAAAAPVAFAAIVTPPATVSFYGFAAGSGVASVLTTTPDGSAGNDITVDKSFSSFSTPGGAVVVVGIAPSLGSTNYLVTETVHNFTNSTWTDYHFGVGCGSIFEDDCLGGPLKMDLGVTPTLNQNGSFALAPWTLGWTGISIAPNTSATFTFGISTACTNCSGDWGIEQRPSLVPEPTSAALFGIGLAVVFGGRGWLRRR